MKLIIHDLGEKFNELLSQRADAVICADGKYAHCQGCFKCWTKNPGKCFMKDRLQEECRAMVMSDSLTVITENCYGSYSPAVKAVLDRCIGGATPLSTYRGGQMHHCLRRKPSGVMKVIVYGDITPAEKATFELLVKRNAINYGFDESQMQILNSIGELEEMTV